jgi:hypothetical protein
LELLRAFSLIAFRTVELLSIPWAGSEDILLDGATSAAEWTDWEEKGAPLETLREALCQRSATTKSLTGPVDDLTA